ncbi:amino acid/polyamine transporter I [Fusarium sp. MPI-SDFR-AT-0072]|nr:amino acid/polyamine transporter I [Fusarium sp. MPI-SDFR-AT-0072]
MTSITSVHPEGGLRPRLSKLTMVSLGFAVLNTWIALGGTIGLVLPSGGPVALLYGFIFCVLCNYALVSSMGELTAIWPFAGGQYHYVYALCSERWKRPLFLYWMGEYRRLAHSWDNGSIIFWLVNPRTYFRVSKGLRPGTAQFISAAAVVGSSGQYTPEPWSTYLFGLAVLTFATAVNIWGNRILGRWTNLALWWSLLCAVIVSIVLLSMSEKTDARFVFTSFDNQTGWSDGMAWMLGLLQPALSLIGFDATLHMTEDMLSPSQDAPLAMLYAIVIGGITGLAFILVMLFCLVDFDTVVSSPSGMPLIELILQATKSRAAACIISSMLAACFVNAMVAGMASVSRLVYAMARDKGMPYHEFFGRVDAKLGVPVRALLFVYCFNLLFGLLYLGPAVAFNAYIASCTIFLNISYALPIIVLLLRGRRILATFQTADTPWQLGKHRGLILNWISVLYVSVATVFFCFPPSLPATGNYMNYVSAVIGIFLILFVTHWTLYGKKFEGPQFDFIMGLRLAMEIEEGQEDADLEKTTGQE